MEQLELSFIEEVFNKIDNINLLCIEDINSKCVDRNRCVIYYKNPNFNDVDFSLCILDGYSHLPMYEINLKYNSSTNTINKVSASDKISVDLGNGNIKIYTDYKELLREILFNKIYKELNG